MNFEMKNEVGARFKLVARKASTEEITRESEWFSNIVLDTGLTQMGAGTWVDRCRVGSGNSTPVATQTQLDSVIASTTATTGTATAGIQVTTKPYYNWLRRTYRFAEGVAAGNISEVGLGWGTGTALWNRALIKDLGGSPTTITVLSDEFLDVIVEIRFYPMDSFSGSFNLLSKTGTVVSTHTYQGMPYFGNVTSASDVVNVYQFSAYSGVMGGSVTTLPTTLIGSTYTPPKTTILNGIRFKPVFALTDGNGSMKSFYAWVTGLGVIISGNGAGYKFEINPPIVKTNQMELTFTMNLTWGRYTGA